jgi:hypothetical protein
MITAYRIHAIVCRERASHTSGNIPPRWRNTDRNQCRANVESGRADYETVPTREQI